MVQKNSRDALPFAFDISGKLLIPPFWWQPGQLYFVWNLSSKCLRSQNQTWTVIRFWKYPKFSFIRVSDQEKWQAWFKVKFNTTKCTVVPGLEWIVLSFTHTSAKFRPNTHSYYSTFRRENPWGSTKISFRFNNVGLKTIPAPERICLAL